jgi:hypothetical protein
MGKLSSAVGIAQGSKHIVDHGLDRLDLVGASSLDSGVLHDVFQHA